MKWLLESSSISCLRNFVVLPFVLELVLLCHFPAETSVEAAGASSLHFVQVIAAVEQFNINHWWNRITKQELVQAGIRRCWEAAGTSSHFLSICTGVPLLLFSYSWSRVNPLSAVTGLDWGIVILGLRPLLAVRWCPFLFLNLQWSGPGLSILASTGLSVKR